MIEIQNYQTHHQPYFEKLNRDWIEKYFWMEPIDFEVLQNPEAYILKPGGFIFMANFDNKIVGTVALKKVNEKVYEFTKMAVEDKHQGKKIGKILALTAIEKAKQLEAQRIILYSNTILSAAIYLYQSIGFKEVPLDGPYKRSNIKMELTLP